MLLAESTRLLSFFFNSKMKAETLNLPSYRKAKSRSVLQFFSIERKKTTLWFSKSLLQGNRQLSLEKFTTSLFAHLPNHIVPTPEQFTIRALKRYSENSIFPVTRLNPVSHLGKAFHRNSKSQTKSNDQTVARQKAESLNSSTHLQKLESSRSGWSLFALLFSSCCILLIRCYQYNQTSMRASLLTTF